MICVECLNNVSSACATKRKCIEADHALRKTKIVDVLVPNSSCNIIENKSEMLRVQDTVKSAAEQIEGNFKLPNSDAAKTLRSLRLRQPRKRKTEVDSFLLVDVSTAKQISSLESQTKLPELEKNLEQDNKIYSCDLCKFSSKRKKNVERHILAVHMKSFKFSCEFEKCTRQYTTQAALKLHCVRDHDENSPYKCEKCNQKFSCDSLFKIHGQRLTCRPRKNFNSVKIFEKSLKCPHCVFKTAHQFSLTQHVNLIHLRIRKKWKCSHCKDKEFSNRTSLNHHNFSFHNLSHVRCPDCDQAFTDELHLKNHKNSMKCNARIATESDYEETSSGVNCKLCNRNYRSKKEWITHYFNFHKFNTTCDVCNVQLSTYASLKNHKKTIHDKLKPFKCTECPKAFSAKHTLEFHKNTHSGLKPFQCKHCSFKASDRSSISKHQKKLHAVKPCNEEKKS